MVDVYKILEVMQELREEGIVESNKDAHSIFSQVQNIHREMNDFDEGDLTDRIYWFDNYKLTSIPITDLDLNEHYVDDTLVDEYVNKIKESPITMPPIVYDPIARSIIDGVHRANAYAKLGYSKIPAYVGLTKSDSYGEHEEVDEGQIYSTGGGAGESQRYYNAKPAGTIIEPDEKVNEASPDTLEGSFTPDLVESKTWLAKMLAKGLKGKNAGTIYILGSWYGNMAIFLQQAGVNFKKIVLVEPDEEKLMRSKDLLQQLNDEGKLILIHQKAEDIVYEKPCVVINTSCNETGPVFLTKLPDNVLCCLQARNNNEDSLFPTEDMEDFVDYFPLSKTYYTGKKYLEDPEVNYVRYMMIGRSGKKVVDETVSTGLGGGSAGNNGGQMVGGPTTYEQEYGMFKSKGPRRITAMTNESTANTITLADIYDGAYPDEDELIWNFVGENDFDIPFEVNTIQPFVLDQLLCNQYGVDDIEDLFHKMQPEQEAIINDYQHDINLSQQVIVLYKDRIIDGNHRALAAVLANKPIKYIDIGEENEHLD